MRLPAAVCAITFFNLFCITSTTAAPQAAGSTPSNTSSNGDRGSDYFWLNGHYFPTLEAYSFSSGEIKEGTHAGPFQFAISSDRVSYFGENYVDGLWIQHNFGGHGTRGSRDALFASLSQVAPTENHHNVAQYYVGGVFVSTVNFNESGRTGFSNLAGSDVGLNVISKCNVGATYFYTCNAAEFDTSTAENEHVGHKFGLLMVLSSGDASRGDYDDSAVDFTAGSHSSHGWASIFQFGKSDASGDFSSATALDTTLLRCSNGLYKCPIGTGIDLQHNWIWPAQGLVFMSPGFAIDADGNVRARSYNTTSVKGVTCPAGTVNPQTMVITDGIVTHC